MSLSDAVEEIIDGYTYKTAAERGILGRKKGKKIVLREECTQQLFSDLFQKTCAALGDPVSVHSYYGFVWEKEGEALACNMIERYPGYDAIEYFLFRKVPSGRKISYREYVQIVGAVRRVFAAHGFSWGESACYFDDEFFFLGNGPSKDCFLNIKRHSLFFSVSTKEPLREGMVRVVSVYKKKVKILLRDAATVERMTESCFAAAARHCGG